MTNRSEMDRRASDARYRRAHEKRIKDRKQAQEVAEAQAVLDRAAERRTAVLARRAEQDVTYREWVARLARPTGHGNGW